MLTRPQVQRYAAESGLRDVMIAEKEVVVLSLPEILAEKIRAGYQRNKARDVYDLGMFATKPLDQRLVRRLVVLKLWQAGDRFDPERLLRKLEVGDDFDWNDLGQLLRRTVTVDRDRITADCARGFRFLLDLTEDERTLAADSHHRERDLWERLSEGARNEALLRAHR